MDSITPILKVLLPIAIGAVLAQVRVFDQEDGNRMRNLCVRFTIPQLVFCNMYSARVEAFTQIMPMVMSLLVLTLMFFMVGWGTSRLFSDQSRKTAVHACITFGNCGWIGWAVAKVFLGDDGFTRAVFFTLLWWPVFYGVGLLIGLIHCGREKDSRPWRLVLKMAAPAIAAIILGTGLNYARVKVPDVLYSTVQSFGDMSIPLILLSVGVQLEFRNMHSQLFPASCVSFVRLFVGPLLGFITVLGIRTVVGCDPTSALVILIQSAMPVASMTPVLSESYKMDRNVVGAGIVLSTVISLLSVPMWLKLLGPLL